jgi:hypothetical protein|tara:strand:+ start:881 stop:1162 length:282 start_codon:yes stop_codon:yes gene_type:complete
MAAYDNFSYYSYDKDGKDTTFQIVNQVQSKDGQRDFKNNCNLSYSVPEVSGEQNVVWGSQKLVKETCPNKVDMNKIPSHYAWNNLTKRISIVE